MDDFYMQSEIKDRERTVRERHSTPQPPEESSRLLASLTRLIAWPVRQARLAASRAAPASRQKAPPLPSDSRAADPS